MKTTVGLWIDHKKAVIVVVTDKGEEIRQIRSNIEKHVRFSAGSASQNPSGSREREDKREKRFGDHLSRYYDEVISCIRDAESILIFGPGEAKGELKKRIKTNNLSGRIVGIETVDKMTDGQIAAKVRQYFLK